MNVEQEKDKPFVEKLRELTVEARNKQNLETQSIPEKKLQEEEERFHGIVSQMEINAQLVAEKGNCQVDVMHLIPEIDYRTAFEVKGDDCAPYKYDEPYYIINTGLKVYLYYQEKGLKVTTRRDFAYNAMGCPAHYHLVINW